MARKPSTDANLATIAKQLGISVSTASRALRDADGINQQTRTKVLEVAEALGYNPGKKHPPIETRPHNILALTQSGMPNTDQLFLSGMSRASIALNLAILSHHVLFEECESILDPAHQPAAMRAGLVEGLVLIHRWPTEIAKSLSQKWPTVSLIHHYPDTSIDQISTDDRPGVSALVRHLIATGRSKIGFFGLCPDVSWSCSRFAAFVESLVRAGLPYEPKDVIEISLPEALAVTTFEDSGWGAKIAARRKAGVNAWVCPSSATGHTLCRHLLNLGVRIPEEVALTGFHRPATLPSDLPVLTTTMIEDPAIGATALRQLLYRFEHAGESQRSILLPTHFVQGETTLKER